MKFDSNAELLLVQHLYGKIRDDLTGSSVTEILDEVPRNRLNAGVLMPLDLEGLPTTNSDTGLASFAESQNGSERQAIRVDTNSSMSMDFQVQVPKEQNSFVFQVRPRMSVYYAVFPTYQEIVSKEGDKPREVESDTFEVEDSNKIFSDPLDQETVPDADLLKPPPAQSIPQQLADEVVQSVSSIPHSDPGSVFLPVKFRKRVIELEAIEIQLDLSRPTARLELRDPLTRALADARERIVSEDPEAWKHLGRPDEAARELKGTNILISERRYLDALAAAQSQETALPAWRAYISITVTPTSNSSGISTYRVNVALVNATPAVPRSEYKRSQIEECALFNCGLDVVLDQCELKPFEFYGAAKDYRLDRNLDSVGRNCVVEYRDGVLSTETVPLYKQPWYRTRDSISVRFSDLDDSPQADPLARLSEVADAMDDYLTEWDGFLSDAADSGELDESQMSSCQGDREQFAKEIERFRLGIECLSRDSQLLRSFRLTNRAFRDSVEQRSPRIISWRLFQIAFIVMELPSLAVRENETSDSSDYARLLNEHFKQADVLWFPTGGGKTEAYLGLITCALFFDRLRGKDRGVTAWMRFPLRMLSLQQLERLAQIMARAEMVRSQENDLRQRGDPFAVGYFVGSGNTPNRIRDTELQSLGRSREPWKRQQVLRHCPYCGDDVSIRFDEDSWRLLHVCENPECFTNTSTTLGDLRGSLPIFVVDTEIYRYRPSVLVGTVDKLAILGMQRYFAHLISSVEQRCPDHGYASLGQCVESVAGGPCKVKASQFVKLLTERDPAPSLVIQDELHLLKEELGTFNAHYEGFLDYLPRKQGGLPPKILAATATIEAYDNQIFHLYLKDAIRFPQPSWRSGESFYATSTPLQFRRLYAGVMTHQRSPESATLRALEVYHRELQYMAEHPEAARVRLGLDTINDDDFVDALRLYDLSLAYVNRKATGGNIAYNLNQSVSPRLEKPLSVAFLTGDNTMTEVGRVVEQIEREIAPTNGERLDTLIATSLISHGVDIERINFMCMVGMPSRFAEYIQASSRAARSHVGLVLVCFKRGDLRERSQYHYFYPNHRYLDRLVETVPINRFSAFAVKRTVPGLLSGLLLSYYSRLLMSQKVINRPLDRIQTIRTASEHGHLPEESLLGDLNEIIGCYHPGLEDLQRRHLSEAVVAALQENWESIIRSLESSLFDTIHPMTSFRDIDDVLDFVSDGPSAAFVERLQAN